MYLGRGETPVKGGQNLHFSTFVERMIIIFSLDIISLLKIGIKNWSISRSETLIFPKIQGFLDLPKVPQLTNSTLNEFRGESNVT